MAWCAPWLADAAAAPSVQMARLVTGSSPASAHWGRTGALALSRMLGSPGLVASGGSCGSGGFVLAATPGGAQVSLSWCQPADGPNSPNSPYYGYNIYEGTTQGGESTQVNSSPLSLAVTSYDVTGLTDATTYYFVVDALGKTGSYPSTEASATPTASSSAPGAPTGLAATAGSSQVSLSWTAPQSDGGSPVTSYNVYQGTFQGGESKTPVTTATGTSVTVTGLTNGTTYYFTVAAVNATGQGPPSGEASATPETVSLPGAPTGLTATAGNSEVTLSWTAPAAAGAPVTGYNI